MEFSIPAPALWALAQLNQAGHQAFLVGGCVRDLHMGRSPGDYDIATSALPDQTRAVFAGCRVIETGLRHGTLTVLAGGLPLEITTYRVESGYSDHRHPDQVRFTSRLEEDLARRDFTVNAMAWHPALGLRDPFGGRADLAAGLLRCVGRPEDRFGEDALRMLRALRFSAQLGFALDGPTARAALALRRQLDHVSRERIAAELTKLLLGPNARRVVCQFWPILAVPIPELGAMAGLDQHSKYHCYDVLTHCAVALEAAGPDKLLRWAALLHDVAKPPCFTLDSQGRGHFYGHARLGGQMTEEILNRLRFDRDTVRRVRRLVELHDYPIDPPEGSPERAVKRLLRRLGEEDFFRLLDLKRADALAHAPQYRGRAALCDDLETLARQILAEGDCFTLKELAVHGDDLIAAGWAPGPALGRTLAWLLGQVEEGRLENDRQTLLDAASREKKPE